LPAKTTVVSVASGEQPPVGMSAGSQGVFCFALLSPKMPIDAAKSAWTP